MTVSISSMYYLFQRAITINVSTYQRVTTRGVIGLWGSSYFLARPKSAEDKPNNHVKARLIK